MWDEDKGARSHPSEAISHNLLPSSGLTGWLEPSAAREQMPLGGEGTATAVRSAPGLACTGALHLPDRGQHPGPARPVGRRGGSIPGSDGWCGQTRRRPGPAGSQCPGTRTPRPAGRPPQSPRPRPALPAGEGRGDAGSGRGGDWGLLAVYRGTGASRAGRAPPPRPRCSLPSAARGGAPQRPRLARSAPVRSTRRARAAAACCCGAWQAFPRPSPALCLLPRTHTRAPPPPPQETGRPSSPPPGQRHWQSETLQSVGKDGKGATLATRGGEEPAGGLGAVALPACLPAAGTLLDYAYS